MNKSITNAVPPRRILTPPALFTPHAGRPLSAPVRSAFQPAFAPIDRAAIRMIDPAAPSPVQPAAYQPVAKPAAAQKTARNKKLSGVGSKLAAGAAGAATLLATAAAFAADGAIPQVVAGAAGLISRIPLGPFGIAATILLTLNGVRLGYKRYQELKDENLQSATSATSLNNPTPWRMFKTIVLPFAGLTLGVGTAMSYVGLLEKTIGLATGAISWPALVVVGGYFMSKALAACVKAIYQHYRYKTHYEQPNLVQPRLIPRLLLHVLGRAALVSAMALQAHISEIYATHFIDTLFRLPHGVVTTFGSALIPILAVGGALAGGIYHLVIGRKALTQGAPLKNIGPLAWTTVKAMAKGAAAGVVIGWLGAARIVTNLVCFGVAAAFGHNFHHSTTSQTGGIAQGEKKRPVITLQELNEPGGPRSAEADTMTMYRPGVDMIDTLIAGYQATEIRQGAHLLLNAANGCYTPRANAEARQMGHDLIERDMQKNCRLLQAGYLAVKNAGSVEQAYEAAAAALDKIAWFLDDDKLEHPEVNDSHPIAWGDLRSRSGLAFLKDNTFRAGLPGAENERSDQDLRVQGLHIRFAATIMRRRADLLRTEAVTYAEGELASVKAELEKKLNAEFCRALIPLVMPRARIYTNLLADSYNTKQILTDVIMKFMAHFVGYTEVAVLNSRGKIEVWAVPRRIVNEYKRDYRTVKTAESRFAEGEDLRREHIDRLGPDSHGGHDIGDSLCEIAYVSDYALWLAEGKNLKYFPTLGTMAPQPVLEQKPLFDPLLNRWEEQQFRDIVYQNGGILRVFADGSHRVIGELPARSAAVLGVAHTERHEHVAKQINDGNTAGILHGIETNDAILARLAKGDIPHPQGGSLTLDPWNVLVDLDTPATNKFTLSDADQGDLECSNQEATIRRAEAHLRVMTSPVRTEKVPFSEHMAERTEDSLLAAVPTTTWMMAKASWETGEELFIPLNLNKENENTFGDGFRDFWKNIDHHVPLEMVETEGRYYLRITLQERIEKGPSLRRVIKNLAKSPLDISIVEGESEQKKRVQIQVPLPYEMADLAEQLKTARIAIDPVRYGKVGGQVPIWEYTFQRRETDGSVLDRGRGRRLPLDFRGQPHLADMLLRGINSHLSEAEIEHMELVGELAPRQEWAWTDRRGTVHMRLSAEEYAALQPWLPPFSGKEQPVYDGTELRLNIRHFRTLCREVYEQSTFRRYMPDERYRGFSEPTATW
jgi:hypothetical protein